MPEDFASALYSYDVETQDPLYDVPICQVVDFRVMRSVTTAEGTSVTLYNLTGLELFTQYTICFETSTLLLELLDFKVWNDVSNVWELDETSVEVTKDNELIPEGEEIELPEEEENLFCRRMSKSGIIGLFNKLDDNPKRLYEGFILYIIIIIDVFLIVGVIIGSQLDIKNASTVETINPPSN